MWITGGLAYIHVCLCLYACMYVYAHTHTHTRKRARTHKHTRPGACMKGTTEQAGHPSNSHEVDLRLLQKWTYRQLARRFVQRCSALSLRASWFTAQAAKKRGKPKKQPQHSSFPGGGQACLACLTSQEDRQRESEPRRIGSSCRS